MNLGDIARNRLLTLFLAALALFAVPQLALAQPAGSAPPPSESSAVSPSQSAQSPNVDQPAEVSTNEAVPSGYTPLGPDMIKGQPVDGGIDFQAQYSRDGDYAYWMHTWILLPLITVISLFVLALLLWVVVRYNRRANPVPSKTSHNTVIEVVWTVVPVLILVAIAIPSITLLARQYDAPPRDALTVKVTGNQWNWTYAYPDNGGFEYTSLMLNEPGSPVVNNGVREVGTSPYDGPSQLEVDNRLVLPVGETIRLQVTASDVIHSFGIPSLWFKIDAVPGRLNERTLFIEEPGIYYGQCMELCGSRHAYMPIAIEALPRAQFEAWVRSKGGTVGDEEATVVPASAAPLQQPESAVEGAPGANAADVAAPEATPAAGNGA